MKSKNSVFALIAIFVLILIINGVVAFKEFSKVPSEKWGKSVLIGSGDINIAPSILKNDKGYNVAYCEKEQVKLVDVSKEGKVIVENVIEAGTFVTGVELLQEETGKVLYYTAKKNDEVNLYKNYISDGKDKFKLENYKIDQFYKINDETSITAQNGFITINSLEEGKNKITSINVKEKIVDLFGEKKGNNLVVIYMNKENKLKFFTMENGKISQVKAVDKFSMPSNQRLSNFSVNFDDKEVQVLADLQYNYVDAGIMAFKFNINTGGDFVILDKKIQMSEIGEICNHTYTLDPNNGVLLGRVNYIKGKNESTSLFEFKLENETPKLLNKVSYNETLPIFAKGEEDHIIYTDFIKKDKKGIYLTSTDEEFKAINNKWRWKEVGQTLWEELNYILYSFAFLITYQLGWIIPAVIILAVSFMLSYKLRHEDIKYQHLVNCALAFIIKLISIRKIFYGRFITKTSFLYNGVIMFLVFGVISLVTAIFIYYLYKKNGEDDIVKAEFLGIAIDAYLTQLVLVPFMI